ncbi:MAG: DUF979 domain-containing protein [Erysipelothrix sp.]|nr:DUF979 domain-containing protein [Erysipelothrix sp.]
MNAWRLFLEMWYVLIGFILLASAINGYKGVKDNRKYGVFAFWTILAVLFAAGPYIPNKLNGILVIAMGVLSALKLVNLGDIKQVSDSFRMDESNKHGNLIFIPSLIIAFGAFLFASVLPKIAGDALSASDLGYIAIGISAVLGLISLIMITKAPVKYVVEDGSRLVRTMGSFLILPQLLGALGAIFTAAGLGDVVAHIVGSMIPQGNVFLGVVAYVVGMALFTMIMGNGFAAFTVITVGVGIPFVISQGADPVIASALAMTAGFCGTLLTPMAANFNIVSATLLETKSQYTVIKYQVPFALAMLVAHILMMYFFAF